MLYLFLKCKITLFLSSLLFFKLNLLNLILKRYLNLNLDLNFFNLNEDKREFKFFLIILKDFMKIFLFLDLRENLVNFIMKLTNFY
jgi:hypothetical protein